MHILWWIIVGLLVGWISGRITKGYGYGRLMDMVMGSAGAVIGGFIMVSAGFSGQDGKIYTTLVVILGAVILTVFSALVSGKRRYA